jgi:hypothetical protein
LRPIAQADRVVVDRGIKAHWPIEAAKLFVHTGERRADFISGGDVLLRQNEIVRPLDQKVCVCGGWAAESL